MPDTFLSSMGQALCEFMLQQKGFIFIFSINSRAYGVREIHLERNCNGSCYVKIFNLRIMVGVATLKLFLSLQTWEYFCLYIYF